MSYPVMVWQPLPSTHESVTVSSTAIGLSATKYGPIENTSHSKSTYAHRALITIEGDQIRWTCDGTVPTSTVGHRGNVDDVIELVGFDAIRLFKAIRLTTDATLKASYFGG
jgi:hypothetical protein